MKKSVLPYPSLRQIIWIGLAAVVVAAIAVGLMSHDRRTKAPEPRTVVVYKSPTCNCCSNWVEHLRQSGFKVEVHNQSAINPLKAKLGIPQNLASCHTATVDGYVIEGHVPAGDIRRLLAEKPQAKGLAVPGMPIGSPGMEQGDRVDPYDVLLFDGRGEPRVFATHGQTAGAR